MPEISDNLRSALVTAIKYLLHEGRRHRNNAKHARTEAEQEYCENRRDEAFAQARELQKILDDMKK